MANGLTIYELNELTGLDLKRRSWANRIARAGLAPVGQRPIEYGRPHHVYDPRILRYVAPDVVARALRIVVALAPFDPEVVSVVLQAASNGQASSASPKSPTSPTDAHALLAKAHRAQKKGKR